MFKVEKCDELHCDVYYKPLSQVLKLDLETEYADTCVESEDSLNKEEKKTSSISIGDYSSSHKISKLYTDYRDKLIYLLTYKIKDKEVKEHIMDFIEDCYDESDKDIYNYIIDLLEDYSIHENTDRGSYRINTIDKYVDNWHNISPSFYLDVGCFHGDITKSIKSHFDLNKFQTHGIDIKKYANVEDDFIYKVYDGKHIPYNNESFDLVTCFMVLHHIPPENLQILLSELYRVMKPKGVLIIREHSAEPEDYILLDVLHEYYDYVLNPSHIWEESKAHYNTADFWSDCITSAGFECCKNPTNIARNNPKNPFNNYITSFTKPKKIIPSYDLFRLLSDDFPRQKYERRSKDKRDYIHWGQRKLLISEIEFLCLFFKTKPVVETKEVVVVYAGAAPGTHITILHDLFPDIKFILYDPANFSNAICDAAFETDKIEIYQELFTDDICAQLKEKYSQNSILLFMSDIRTADITTMSDTEVEEHVITDQKLQLDWYNLLMPDYSMFKFRLPWNNAKTLYLDGDIYIQAYSPLSSTETRLIVDKNAAMKEYDNKAYEEQMFYFNKYRRDANYSINGIEYPYDIAVEKHILNLYNDLNLEYKIQEQKQEQKQEQEHAQEFVNSFSDKISKTLSKSRTLTSAHPLSYNKKELIKKLVKEGLVPSNIKYNTTDYNLYVLPILVDDDPTH